MPFEARTREQELLARIGPLYREAAAANVAPKAQLDVEQTMLRRACMDYVLSRNRLLDDIWRVLDAPAGNPREPLVRNILATLAPLAKRGFSERIRNLSAPTAQADLFCIRAENEEAAFFAGLSKVVEMASKRDLAAQYLAAVKKQADDLDVRWKDLERQHGVHEEAQKRTADELLKMLSGAAAAAAAKTATRNEQIVKALAILLKLPIEKLLPEIELKNALNLLREAVKYWRAVYDMTPVRKQMLRSAYLSEAGTTVVLYRDFHAETRRFIEAFGYERLLKECGRGEAALEEFVAACPSDGQKADMRIFVDELKRVLRLRRDEGKACWDDFVKRHERKFFGPMSPQNLEAMLSDKAWHERENLIVNTHENLLSLLSAWRDEAKQHQFISMSSQGEELRLLLAPVVQEFVELIRVWELNLRLEGELESLCDDRENDVRSLI